MSIKISLTELRQKLPKVMDRISKYSKRYVINRRGKAEAVILSKKDYDGLLETLDIYSDQNLVKDIRKAREELRKGKCKVFSSEGYLQRRTKKTKSMSLKQAKEHILAL